MRSTGFRGLAATFALAGFLASGCSSELAPEPSPVLESPELSQPREPHKTAAPPPPIREHRHPSAYASAEQAAQAGTTPTAPSTSSTPPAAAPETQGHVAPLSRAPGSPEDGDSKPPTIVR